MNGGKVVAALAAVVLAQQAMPAWAQAGAAPTAPAASQPGEPVDAAKLALGRQIIAVMLPPEQRGAIIKRMQQAIMASFSANFRLPAQLDDPGLTAIFKEYLDSVPGLLEPVMAQQMPGYFEAMARAYARAFTQAELEQILAFAHTPAGTKYLERSTTLLQDPDVAAAMGGIVRAAQQESAKSAAGLQAKVRTYLTAHPEVAKRLSEAAKKPS